MNFKHITHVIFSLVIVMVVVQEVVVVLLVVILVLLAVVVVMLYYLTSVLPQCHCCQSAVTNDHHLEMAVHLNLITFKGKVRRRFV